MEWAKFYESELVDADVIAGLSGVESLLARSPYPNINGYFTRVERAVDVFPSEHQEGALAAFAAVTYAPQQLIDATYRHFHDALELAFEQELRRPLAGLQDIHLFEVDPSGLMNEFALKNRLSQRLNHTVLARVNSVDDILRSFDDVLSEDDVRSSEGVDELLKIAEKPAWVVLTDKALSGQSLVKDVKRIATLREVLSKASGDPVTLYVCAQVISEDAIEGLGALHLDGVKLFPGLVLDRRMKVSSDSCSLFLTPQILKRVRAAAQWFADTILSPDRSFDAVRKQSGDNLAFGYRASGLLFSDFRNCPTNSLPFLWYSSRTPEAEYDAEPLPPEYHGPFPRVDSRRGKEKVRRASGRWEAMQASGDLDCVRDLVSRGNHADGSH